MLRTLAKLLVAGACLGVDLLVRRALVLRRRHSAIGMAEAGRRGNDGRRGGSAFFGAAYALRVAELHDIVVLFQRKLKR